MWPSGKKYTSHTLNKRLAGELIEIATSLHFTTLPPPRAPLNDAALKLRNETSP